jgi:hypothetical protein
MDGWRVKVVDVWMERCSGWKSGEMEVKRWREIVEVIIW